MARLLCPVCEHVLAWVAIAGDSDGGWYRCDHRHRWRHVGDRLIPRAMAVPRALRRDRGAES